MRSVDYGLRFDRWQFDGRRARPVRRYSSRDENVTGLSYEDYAHMGQQRRGGAGALHFIPDFTQNDKKLRLALAQYAWAYVGSGGTRVPDSLAGDWKALKRFVDARTARGSNLSKDCPAGQRAQYEAFRKSASGKWLERLAGVAYRTWRLREDSVAIADALGITPVAVRQIRWRILRTAEALGFDIGTLGRLRGGRPTAPLKPASEKVLRDLVRKLCTSRNQKVVVSVALEMRAQNKTLAEIAKVFGSTRTGVWLALKKHKEQGNESTNQKACGSPA